MECGVRQRVARSLERHVAGGSGRDDADRTAAPEARQRQAEVRGGQLALSAALERAAEAEADRSGQAARARRRERDRELEATAVHRVLAAEGLVEQRLGVAGAAR